MRRLVQTIALAAALGALALGVWRDYGPYTAVRQAVVAYLVAYFLSGTVGLAGKAALRVLRDPDPEPEPDPREKRRRRRQQQQQLQHQQSPPASRPAAPAPEPAPPPAGTP